MVANPLKDGLKAYQSLVGRNHDISRQLAKMEPDLKKKANVVGYGVGLKKQGKYNLNQPAAIIYVWKKLPLTKLKHMDRLPKTILVKGKRIPTDVVVLRKLQPLGNNSENIKWQRPINIGAQIEAMVFNQDVEISPDGYGTVGAVVKDRKIAAMYLLSCAHVLHAVHNDIIQPSKLNGQGNATKADKEKKPKPDYKDGVGSVRKLAGGGIDAGYVEASATTTAIIGIGPCGSIQKPIPGLPVMKSGATTGVTEGRVDNVDQKVFDRLANGLANIHPEIFAGQKPSQFPSLKDLFLVKPSSFGSGGDSGSLIVVGPESALKDWIDKTAGMKELNQKAKEALKKSLLYSAVGLLCYTGAANSVKYQGFIGQELQTALDALDVDLVT